MSYPEPNPDSSRERLYAEAMLFYREYERMKHKVKKMEAALKAADTMVEVFIDPVVREDAAKVYRKARKAVDLK